LNFLIRLRFVCAVLIRNEGSFALSKFFFENSKSFEKCQHVSGRCGGRISRGADRRQRHPIPIDECLRKGLLLVAVVLVVLVVPVVVMVVVVGSVG
jgi:hypothetical protein